MYLLFAGPIYYPAGGFGDFQGCYEHRHAASLAGEKYVAAATPSSHRWYHVVEVEGWNTVDRGYSPAFVP